MASPARGGSCQQVQLALREGQAGRGGECAATSTNRSNVRRGSVPRATRSNTPELSPPCRAEAGQQRGSRWEQQKRTEMMYLANKE